MKMIKIILIILVLFWLAGCKNRQSRNPAPAPSSSPSQWDSVSEDAGGDSEELLDMYERIYGADAIDDRGGRVRVELDWIYGHIKKMKHKQVEAHYKKLLGEGEKLESERHWAKAAKKFRECAYIENNVFKKPGLGTIALERLSAHMLRNAEELKQKDKLKEALAFADIAVYCEPGNPQNLRMAGILFSKTGDEGLAIPYLMTALKNNPEDGETKYLLKTMYLLEGHPEKAIPLITPDISEYTRLSTHWADLAEAYFMVLLLHPDREDAEKQVGESLKKAINHKNVSKKGKIELEISRALFENDFEAALLEFDELEKINIDPAIQTRIDYNRGLINLALKKRNAGVDYLEKTVSRVRHRKMVTQGENYMALMSLWILDVMEVAPLNPKEAREIFALLDKPDHSYNQEFNFIHDYLTAREKSDWNAGADAMVRLTQKRHLEPIGDFVQDILQVPAEKALVYISMGAMYEKAGDLDKAKKSFEEVEDNPFLGYKARFTLRK